MSKRSASLFNLVLAASLALAGCGGGGGGSDGGNDNDNDQGNNSGDNDSVVTVDCSLSIEEVLDNIGEEIPSWEQIDCYTDDLVRETSPAFMKRILLTSDTLSETSNAWREHLMYIEESWDEYPINVSNAFSSAFPPYPDPDNPVILYPLTPEQMDVRLRAYATLLIHEKSKGRPVFFIQFWPPDQEYDIADSATEFQNWLDEVYLPEKASEAEAAERVKAEYYVPFHLEVDVFMNGLGEWFDDLPENEKVALAQSFVDQVHDTVRPLFSGTLIAHSYARYAAIGDFWTDISYAQYDQMNFPIFPECDVAVTEDYLDEQLAGYMEVVMRDGLPYMINELTVYQKYFYPDLPSCDTIDDIEADLYNAIFAKLDALPIQPIGLSVAGWRIQTEAGRNAVIDYFNSK